MAMRPDEVDGSSEVGTVNEVEVRCAFLNFFVAIFMEYRAYMVTDVRGEIFNFRGFLADCTESSRDFMEQVLSSQAFHQFIESRQLEDERNPDVAFFDESISAKKNRSTMRMGTIETPLLSDTETYMNSRTHIPTKPDVTSLPPHEGPYMPGERFPPLKAKLFATLRPNTVTLGESMALRKNHTVLRRTPKKAPVASNRSASTTPVRAASMQATKRMGSLNVEPATGTSPSMRRGSSFNGVSPFTPPPEGASSSEASFSKTPRSTFRFGFEGDVVLETKGPVADFADGSSLKTSIGCILSTYACILAQLSRRQAMRSNKKRWGKLPLSTRHILLEYGGGKGTGTASRQSISGYSDVSSSPSGISDGYSTSSRSRELSAGKSSKKLGLGGKVTVGGHNVHRMGSLEVAKIGSSEVYQISSSDVSRSGSVASVLKGTPSSDISEFSISDAIGRSGSLMSGEVAGNPILGFGEMNLGVMPNSGRNSPVFGGSPVSSDVEDEGGVDRRRHDVWKKRSPDRDGQDGPTDSAKTLSTPTPKRAGRERSDSFGSGLQDSIDSYDSSMIMNTGRVKRSGSFDVLPVPSLMASALDSPKVVIQAIAAFDTENSTYDIALEIMALFSKVADAPDDMPFRLLADAAAIAFDSVRAVHLMSILEQEGIHPDSKIAQGVSIALSASTSNFLSNFSALDVLRAKGWPKLQRHLEGRGVDGLEEFMLDLNEKQTKEQQASRREIIHEKVKEVAAKSSDPLRVAAELESVLEDDTTVEDSNWASPFTNMARAFSTGRDESVVSVPEGLYESEREESEEETKEGDLEAYDPNPHNMEWIDFQTYHQVSTSSADAPKWQRRFVRCISRSLLIRMQWSDEIICRAHPGLFVDLNHEFGTSCPNSLCGRSFDIEELDELWVPDPNNYTITCPDCERAFVPRFAVVSSSPQWKGSDGPHTELWCEMLSPWSLRKEVLTVLKEYGIDVLTRPDFRHHSHQHTVVFWNLIVYFRLRGLPYSFLVTDENI